MAESKNVKRVTDPEKLSRKGEKAKHSLDAINNNIVEMKKILNSIRNGMENFIDEQEPQVKISKSFFDGMPKRILFKLNDIKWFIDFTISTNEKDEILGNIIYGTNRTLCFQECIFPKTKNDGKKNNNKTEKEQVNCLRCERIIRCDGFEDKPLIQFTINRDGMIKNENPLHDSGLEHLLLLKEQQHHTLLYVHLAFQLHFL